MNVTRRQLLKATALGGSLFLGGGWRAVLAGGNKPALVLITGIGPGTSASVLFAMLDPVVSQNIPVGLVVDFSDGDGGNISADSALAAMLRTLVTDYRGLAEVVVRVRLDADASPYFRMRAASEARAAYCRVIGSARCRESGLTAAIGPFETDVDRTGGMRAAGFRNVLVLLPASVPTNYWESGDGVLQVHGGRLLPADGASVVDVVGAPVETDAISVFVLDAETGGIDEKQAFEYGAAVGDALAVQAISGGMYPTLPVEIHARTGRPYGRLVGLVVDAPEPEDLALQSFVSGLEAAGVPFSLSGRDCVAAANGFSPSKISAGATVCLDAVPDIAGLAESGVATVSAPDPDGYYGLDRFGILHLPVGFTFDGARKIRTSGDAATDLIAGTGRLLDCVVAVRSAAVQDERARNALLSMFTEMESKDVGRPVSLDRMRDAVAPQGEIYRLLKSVHYRCRLAKADTVSVPADTDRADAGLAWTFFERTVDPVTGLCPGSADLYDGEVSVYPFTTMWDIGTQIMATISAQRLDVIGKPEFEAAMDRLLANIPTQTLAGMRLPPATVSTTGKEDNEAAFDASDLGRLLVAFRMLQNHSGNRFNVEALVNGWDIAGILDNGRLHSIRNGRLVPLEDSNYAHYAGRGFDLWGFDAKEPYRVRTDYTGFDAEFAILEIAGRNGLISTEPHGLEGVEMGLSDPARTIADTLYALQLAEHEKSGDFVAVSEGTLNRAPWFTYQGYQIGAENPWQVKTVEDLPRYRTAGFRRAAAMTSSKAAFLWAALRPQAYSRDLLRYVRTKTRIEDLGFAPGVFLATKTAMANYSDVNTNGVILQALAYMDAGSVPLLDLADSNTQ